MNIKVGDKITYRGQEYLIVNVSQEETLDGIAIAVEAIDTQTVYNTQEEKRSAEQLRHDILETFKKLFGGKGMGFPFGKEE